MWISDTVLASKLDLVVDTMSGSGTGNYVYCFNADFGDVINSYKVNK